MGSPPGRTSADRWSPGDWNITCAMCGIKMKAAEAVRNWQGTWRHSHCNEPRPAQDFVHAIRQPEMQVPFSQKMAESDVQICTLAGISAVAGYAVAGCMAAGRPFLGDPTPYFTPKDTMDSTYITVDSDTITLDTDVTI